MEVHAPAPKSNFSRAEQYFAGTPDSKPFLTAKNFFLKYINQENFTLSLTDAPEDLERLKAYISELGKKLMPPATPEEIILELRKARLIKDAPVVEKKQKESEFLKTDIRQRLNIVDHVDLDTLSKNIPKVEKDEIPEDVFLELLQESHITLHDTKVDEAYEEYLRENFIHLYNIDEIAQDVRDAREKEERIERLDTEERKKAKKFATILEAMLIDGIKNYNWLGDQINVVPPSKIDELLHGVDGIVELEKNKDENEFLALGIDISFRSVEGDLFEQKVSNLLNRIDQAKLTEIKYLEDKNGGTVEGVNAPMVVISVDAKTMKALMVLWYKAKHHGDVEDFKKSTLAIDIIGQIADQCKIFSQYAKTVGQEEISEKYDEVFDLLLDISSKIPQTRRIITEFESNKFVSKIQEIADERLLTKN